MPPRGHGEEKLERGQQATLQRQKLVSLPHQKMYAPNLSDCIYPYKLDDVWGQMSYI